nr:glycosyltransferase family 4 protein [uncultured Duganella sp.]
MRTLDVLTWHTHGSYLYYLSQAPHRYHVVSRPGRPPGYGGRCGDFPWGDNVFDLPAAQVRARRFDCVIYQDDPQYFGDQYELLTAEQRRLPRIYIEHDTPRPHATDTVHPVDDPGLLLVHVTPYNALMWDSGRTPHTVIEHGVRVPDGVRYRGGRARGLVAVNHLARRGRRLGADLFEQVRNRVPLDLVGMGAQPPAGLGEVSPGRLAEFLADYRFFFHPARYTSLGLAVIEAMMVGLPVVGLATTELPTVIRNGRNGFIDTRPERLIDAMRMLLREPALAREVGARGRAVALERFHIDRFVADWNGALARVTGT